VSVLAREQAMQKCTFPNSDFIPAAAPAGGYRPLTSAFASPVGLARQSFLTNIFPNFDFFPPFFQMTIAKQKQMLSREISIPVAFLTGCNVQALTLN